LPALAPALTGAQLWDEHQRQRRTGMAGFAATLATKTTLRFDETTITDTLWALTPDAYLRLVHEAGWPAEKFQAWLADLLQRLFLP
jgi:TetR/AcrR family transcriptional regulator, regulator of autoinduction and epiphytic fitness